MDKILKPVNVKLLTGNFFRMLDNDWMLITAGTKDKFNTMTASWGTFGILWNKPIAIVFVRPQRYTYEFINSNEYFTVSFFSEQYREALEFCGAHSGRHKDKVMQTGLTPVFTNKGSIYFNQASLVFECKKLYTDSLKASNFIDKELIDNIYPSGDFHGVFMGEITNCLSVENYLMDKGLGFDKEIDSNPAEL